MSKSQTPTTTTADPQTTEDISDRTRRALEEVMTVVPDMGRAKDADGLTTVTSESTYLVDLFGRTCECPDHKYRGAECKHIRRARFAHGEAKIPPAAAEQCEIDDGFAQLTDANPEIATK